MAADPAPTDSSAIRRPPAMVRRSTVTGWPARDAGSAGPAARQRPDSKANIPAAPALVQAPAIMGIPAGLNATAVSPLSPHARPAAEPVTDPARATVATRNRRTVTARPHRERGR